VLAERRIAGVPNQRKNARAGKAAFGLMLPTCVDETQAEVAQAENDVGVLGVEFGESPRLGAPSAEQLDHRPARAEATALAARIDRVRGRWVMQRVARRKEGSRRTPKLPPGHFKPAISLIVTVRAFRSL
jgi:hypothetical protein